MKAHPLQGENASSSSGCLAERGFIGILYFVPLIVVYLFSRGLFFQVAPGIIPADNATYGYGALCWIIATR